MTRWSLRRHRHRAQQPVAGTVRLDPARPELGPAPGGYAPPTGYQADGYTPPGYPAQPGPAAPPGTPRPGYEQQPGAGYPGTAAPQAPVPGQFPPTEFRQTGYAPPAAGEIPGRLSHGGLPPGYPSGLQPGTPPPADAFPAASDAPARALPAAGGAWPEVMERIGLHLLTLAEQLRLSLDELEADEADPERLQKLYRVDHAVTRMRRASRDLRTLAGRADSELSGVDTSVLDVIRMALSAIERYTQVSVGRVTDFAVLGYASDDVAALLAALLDNATRYSPGVTSISARLTDGGSVLFRIEDSGIGMDPDTVAEINSMMSGDVPELDDRTGRHTGFPVVHRIARKYSIGVRLAARPAPNRGLLALVTVPPELMAELPEEELGLPLPPPPAPGRESRVTELPSMRREAPVSLSSSAGSSSSLDPEEAFPVRRPGASGAEPGYASKAADAMAGVSRAQARRVSNDRDDAPAGGAAGASTGLPRREPGSLRGNKADKAGSSGGDQGAERSPEEQSAARRAFADDLAAFSQGSQSAPAPQDPSGKGNPS